MSTFPLLALSRTWCPYTNWLSQISAPETVWMILLCRLLKKFQHFRCIKVELPIRHCCMAPVNSRVVCPPSLLVAQTKWCLPTHRLLDNHLAGTDSSGTFPGLVARFELFLFFFFHSYDAIIRVVWQCSSICALLPFGLEFHVFQSPLALVTRTI